MTKRTYSLDPVTLEVLKNAFMATADQMGEQLIRTCHSFVIYARDFSSCLFDGKGNTIMHGRYDLSGHLGTAHFHAQAVIEAFRDEMHAGDVFAVNDPYVGGSHFSDVRIMRPIVHEGEVIAFAQSSGHWADIGGSAPGSFDSNAKEHFGEGLRIPPVQICDRGRVREDVVRLIVSNTRTPRDAEGDVRAQMEATQVAEREILRLVDKYGLDTLLKAFDEVQDYVEQLTRQQIRELPNGTWETEDYIDSDPMLDEGLIPIKVKMTIDDDQIYYDLSGSHPVIGTFLNSAFGGSYSALYSGTKMFLPEIPLNSGFYRTITVDLGPEGSVVNAPWPIAVSGFCAGSYEKIINSVFELWSEVLPERAIACCYNVEYLEVGGRDARMKDRPIFMWYDWLGGGWGGRSGRDGANATVPTYGAGGTLQPCEGQERLCPVTIINHEIIPDSGGPGKYRGGCGVEKAARLNDGVGTVISYSCDRARSITWGIKGGLPSMPHGVWLNKDRPGERFLGIGFSNVPLASGDVFTRPSAGGGGLGDPLDRDPESVRNDVMDDYVTIERALTDYGVVMRDDNELGHIEVDDEATDRQRASIRSARNEWLSEDAELVASRYRSGELGVLDLVRQYGVILDWGTGELYPRTTETFRAMLRRRAASHWREVSAIVTPVV